MATYINPFSGQTVQPSQVGYELLTLTGDVELQWPVNGNTSLVVANIIEVQQDAADYKVYMPAATQVSTGQSILFNNTGAYSFTVVDYSGNTIVAIASGVAEYVYITDNTTLDGTWSSFAFGAGTSAANAATLAGYGIKAISTTVNQSYPLTTYYSNYVLSDSDRAKFLVWSSGAGSFTLPTASAVGNNWFCMIRNSGSGILTIYPSGVDTIDGNASQQLQITESLVIVANGSSGYSTFGYGQSVQFAFTQLAYDVTGAGATITLSTSQAGSIIQEYYGTLSANTDVVLPPTVQLYTVTNLTSGAYSLTFKTAAVGAAVVSVAQNSSLILVCDGTNVYNANSGAVSSLLSLTIDPGSPSAPALNFTGNTNTGLYQPSSGTIGMALNGVSKLTLESDGLHVVDGIAGGTFS